MQPTGSPQQVAAQPVLSGVGLYHGFGQTRALDGVTVGAAAGEALAVMGPSGSGKSTLLHCLAGILKPDAGCVYLRGQQINSLSENDRTALRRHQFGFVFQSGQLLPELPVEENAALPLILDGVPRRTAVAEARQWLGAVGLGGMETRRPGELSGGQAQRAAVARSLIHKPAVVFADEPTGALDRETGASTMRLLVAATRDRGAALLVVTHDLEVASYCDRVVEVRDGRLAPPTRLKP